MKLISSLKSIIHLAPLDFSPDQQLIVSNLSLDTCRDISAKMDESKVLVAYLNKVYVDVDTMAHGGSTK